ncbi:MAG: helix-turn-helix domain-containing protein [Desulfovibrionaceae bacterium]|nr:helix-turn-helix domain-containing protein [Desulfovibrionaceae bacterium]
MGTITGNFEKRGKILPDVIMKRTDLTMGAKVLYAFLRDSAGNKDHCWPGQRYLAASLKQTVRSVQNHLRRLKELGLIAIRKRPWRGNIYYILDPQTAAPDSSSSPDLVKTRIPVSSPVPAAPATKSLAKAPAMAKPSTSYNRQAAEAAFQRLWEAYPRSEARKPALRHWHRLSRSGAAPALEFLLERIQVHRDRNPKWQRGYAPYLYTWLKDRRWEDPLPLEAARASEAQTKPVLLQKEKPAPAPILQLPAEAAHRLREALALWKCTLTDAESAMVKALWNILYIKNRLPSAETIRNAVRMHERFSKWLNGLFFNELHCFS